MKKCNLKLTLRSSELTSVVSASPFITPKFSNVNIQVLKSQIQTC